MTFFSKLTGWFSRGERTSDLQKNMQKALHMKQAAGPQTNIPEHQTSREGEVEGGQVGYTDTRRGAEPTYTPNLKRSQGARRGDT